MTKLISGITFIFLLIGPLEAQGLLDSLEIESDLRQEPLTLFMGTLIAGGQSLETSGEGELKMFIQHRFGDLSNGLYDFFGLDLATMRLGFEYGISDKISVYIGRSTYEKTYDLGIKTKIMTQESIGKPLSASIHLASSFASMKDIYPLSNDALNDRLSYSGQLLLGRKIGPAAIQVSPTILYNSYDYRIAESVLFYAVGFGGSFKLSDRVSLSAEYYLGLTETGFTYYDPLSIGVDLDTGGHIFQLIFSNTTGMFNKALLTNNTGNWGSGNIFFGFNLIRTFYLK